MTTIFTLEKLFKAYKECQKGKKNTINALEFELHREKNLMSLLDDLTSRKYKISRHICFIATHPTPREIFAADFRDRIVHHLLCNEISGMFEVGFISRSYANRKGKGTHKAVDQLRKDIRQVKNVVGGGAYLKLDVQSFFRSIDKGILFSLVENKIYESRRKFSGDVQESMYRVWEEEVLWLARKIIFHDPTTNYLYKGNPDKKLLIPRHKSLFYSEGKGLPIGNLTSQFFANVYLNELDQFATATLGIERYVRYVDDFIITGEGSETIRKLIVPINTFLNEVLGLKINRNKIQLQETRKGVDFLGYFIKPNYTLVRQKVVRRCKKRLHEISLAYVASAVCDKKELAESVLPMFNSYYGHFSHARSFNLRKHLYAEHMGKMKEFLETDGTYNSFVISNG
ncbi:hypothetical protein D4R49_00825 [bacterium]|nr:MAG: hypothetical protein D4R49_00825 [bacterium]